MNKRQYLLTEQLSSDHYGQRMALARCVRCAGNPFLFPRNSFPVGLLIFGILLSPIRQKQSGPFRLSKYLPNNRKISQRKRHNLFSKVETLAVRRLYQQLRQMFLLGGFPSNQKHEKRNA